MQPLETEATLSAPRRRRPYLRYLAELAVIILGVTLSLLAEDWRQGQEDRRSEQQYLRRLHADLQTDLATLHRNDRQVAISLHAHQQVLRLMQQPDGNLDSLGIWLYQLAPWDVFRPNAASYLALRSSGQLTLLRDERLLNDLVNLHENIYALVRREDEIYNNFVFSSLMPALNETVTYADLLAPGSPGELRTRYAPLLRDRRFHNQLVLGLLLKNEAVEARADAKRTIQTLLAALPADSSAAQ